MCISWKIKCLVLLMHGVTIKLIVLYILLCFGIADWKAKDAQLITNFPSVKSVFDFFIKGILICKSCSQID